jgi:hypothetical protein
MTKLTPEHIGGFVVGLLISFAAITYGMDRATTPMAPVASPERQSYASGGGYADGTGTGP